MLKAVTDNDFNFVRDYLGKGIIPLRILSYMFAYGFDKDFVKFWSYENDNAIRGVIALFENSVILHADENIETGEILTFLSMLSFSSLTCEKSVAEKFGFTVYTEKQGYIFNEDAISFSAENICEDRIKEAYDLISESIPGSFKDTKEAYLSFLSDYTYRERRSLARGKCLIENNKLVTCAFTSAETENEALISGVATHRSLRKGGYGKRTVLSLVYELMLSDKKSYVIALNDSAKSFYEHIGFRKDKLIVYVNRKDI